jgi:hypothetical protein
MIISGITYLSVCYRIDAGTMFRRTNRIEIAKKGHFKKIPGIWYETAEKNVPSPLFWRQ